MKSSIRFALVIAALAAVSIVGARATTVTYEIQFTNPGAFSDYGSGSLTLDDTPVAPHYLGPPYYFTTPTAVGFDFVNVSGAGSGAPGYGAWFSSFLDYDPVTGETMWSLQLDATGLNVLPIAIPGLSPFEAFEGALNMGPTTGWWSWEKSATPVPTPESCSAALLISIGLAALGALGLARRQRS